jgi:hypothetical protein
MSFGESVFSAGFIQKTGMVDPTSDVIVFIRDENNSRRL